MSSERQIAANRANASKSTGPRTQAGKDRSRMNALKHGLTAYHNILPTESEAEYLQLRDAYWEDLDPATPLEAFFVERLIAAAWRLTRAGNLETALMVAELADPNLLPLGAEATPHVKAAAALRRLSDNSSALHLAVRQISANSREHARLLRDLNELRKSRSAAAAADQPEPTEEQTVQPETDSDRHLATSHKPLATSSLAAALPELRPLQTSGENEPNPTPSHPQTPPDPAQAPAA